MIPNNLIRLNSTYYKNYTVWSAERNINEPKKATIREYIELPYNQGEIITKNYIDVQAVLSMFVRDQNNNPLSLTHGLEFFNISLKGEPHDPLIDAIHLMHLYKGILKNHMLIHQVIVPQVYSCIYCCYTSDNSSQLDQHIMSHLTSACSDAVSGDSTSQYSFSEGNKNEDMFTMLQKDMSNKEETLLHFDMKDEEDLDKSLLME